MSTHLFDVIAVNIRTKEERVLETGKTEKNADAIIKMAVMRRGVDVEFYTKRPASPSENEPIVEAVGEEGGRTA